MEEAETLSSRLAIMTKGGKIACHGSTLQIKNEHGQFLNVNLAMKANEVLECEDFDETDVNLADNEAGDYIKGEIFNQLVWTKAQALQMLEQKGMTHLANQVESSGILCPEQLTQEDSDIQANDLWNWYYIHS